MIYRVNNNFDSFREQTKDFEIPDLYSLCRKLNIDFYEWRSMDFNTLFNIMNTHFPHKEIYLVHRHTMNPDTYYYRPVWLTYECGTCCFYVPNHGYKVSPDDIFCTTLEEAKEEVKKLESIGKLEYLLNNFKVSNSSEVNTWFKEHSFEFE